jgi:hypothetical protein
MIPRFIFDAASKYRCLQLRGNYWGAVEAEGLTESRPGREQM